MPDFASAQGTPRGSRGRNGQITQIAPLAHRACASDELEVIRTQTDPGHAQRRIEAERELDLQLKANKLSMQGTGSQAITTTTGGTAPAYMVPVVFHIIHNGGVSNISDAQIMSQLNILNQDFQKTAGSPGAGVGVNTTIGFCLARTTPSGTATTGITRTQSTLTTHNMSTDESSLKALVQWNPAKYLNVWVVSAISSTGSPAILGYATLPGGTAALDGVVIDHNFVGNTGTATSPYNMGRTLTHEVGHYLHLYHTFQGGCAGMTTLNCGTSGDKVCDTPPVASYNASCASSNNSCAEVPDLTDQLDNYMDYTDDVCMSQFSDGQSDRMQGTLQSTRSLLASGNTACDTVAAGTTALPLACAAPAGCVTNTITSNSAKANWTALAGATSYTVQYKLGTATAWTTLANTTAANQNITALTSGTAYKWRVKATCPSGATAYTPYKSFTAAVSSSSCTDLHEPNNTQATAKSIAKSVTIVGGICVSDDDYYKFTVPVLQTNAKVTLSNLGADFDLYLYNSAGVVVGYSINAGTTAEVVSVNLLPAGTYTARVFGYGGATSTTMYNLMALTSAVAFRGGEEEADVFGPEPVLEVYPNPVVDNDLTIKWDVTMCQDDIALGFNGLPQGLVSMHTVDGRTVWEGKTPQMEGENRMKLAVGHLPSGMYIVRVTACLKVLTAKVMISR